ncbi:MAG: membrane protein insertase YidC, partial [Pseudobutyrivibrio sp.]|nr:membrane protein insertase YidC [Pseudobutyrivibrio sp.]MCF0187338.1 membrane protein insertase YidC [Bacteroidaceae bacterium]
KQQQFSVLNKKMQPEMQAINDKYKDKKDQNSMMAKQEETQALYDKYGISPSGSCVNLLIQMPILFALFRVFYNVPAYISPVKYYFSDLVNGIMATDGYAQTMQTIFDNAKIQNIKVDLTTTDPAAMSNYIVDILYKLSSSGWQEVASAFPSLSGSVDTVVAKLEKINYIFLLNISDTPLNMIKVGWTDGKNWPLIICSVLVPVIAYLAQVLSIKLMPTADTGNDQMAQQMKTMNMIMPLMSLYITFISPVGLGLYWAFGAVVRTVQQIFLNKHFEKIDLESIIEKNKEKAAKKAEKRGIRQAQIYEAAKMNTKKTMADKANISPERLEALDKAEALRASAPKTSMAAKANLVKEYNERNNK